MALERECDLFLYELSELCEHDGGFGSNGATYEDIIRLRKVIADNETIKQNFGAIVCILDIDGNIDKVIHDTSVGYKINKKGISFLFSDSYEKRRQKQDVLFGIAVSNGRIQSNLLWLNRWLTIAGVVAALYYVIQMVDYYSNLLNKHFPLYYGSAVTTYLLLLGGVLGAGLTLAIQKIYRLIKNKKSKP